MRFQKAGRVERMRRCLGSDFRSPTSYSDFKLKKGDIKGTFIALRRLWCRLVRFAGVGRVDDFRSVLRHGSGSGRYGMESRSCSHVRPGSWGAPVPLVSAFSEISLLALFWNGLAQLAFALISPLCNLSVALFFRASRPAHAADIGGCSSDCRRSFTGNGLSDERASSLDRERRLRCSALVLAQPGAL